jgi:hypothetical protein
MKDRIRFLRCDTHGAEPWQGDVTCAPDAGGCGAVYQTRDDKLPHFAPYDCPCGAPLMPHKPDGGGQLGPGKRSNFTARSICSKCFAERTAATSS